MYVKLKCRWFNIIILNCYASTENKSNEVKNAFYDELNIVRDGLLLGKLKIIIGAFNVKIERETVYRPTIKNKILHGESNEN